MTLFKTLFTEKTQEFLLGADIPYDDLSGHGIEFIDDSFEEADLEHGTVTFNYIIKYNNKFYSVLYRASEDERAMLLTDTLTEVTPAQKTITVYEPITHNT